MERNTAKYSEIQQKSIQQTIQSQPSHMAHVAHGPACAVDQAAWRKGAHTRPAAHTATGALAPSFVVCTRAAEVSPDRDAVPGEVGPSVGS